MSTLARTVVKENEVSSVRQPQFTTFVTTEAGDIREGSGGVIIDDEPVAPLRMRYCNS